MSRTLFWYVVRTYLVLLLGIFGALLAIFLVADFVDRAKSYSGPNWISDVARLYGFKALVAAHQLGPAALLLSAGTTVSLVRKRGELTALSSLAFGPSTFYAPIGLCALVLTAGLMVFDEYVVVEAGPKIDEITTQRFNRWDDWALHFVPQKWFRRGDRIFYMRSGNTDRGFENVTILRLTPDFRLAERTDAQRMSFRSDTRWLLRGVVRRQFAENGETTVEHADRVEDDFNATASDFRILLGRPEQMDLGELREQIRARNRVGLPSGQFALALHNRFAYPLAALPAVFLTIGLALRLGRRGHLTAALLEGLIIAMGLWGMMVVFRTLVLAKHLSPAIAAWAPALTLTFCAAFLWLGHHGGPSWRQRSVEAAP
jgi:lipopolysaccharide export system permease protein